MYEARPLFGEDEAPALKTFWDDLYRQAAECAAKGEGQRTLTQSCEMLFSSEDRLCLRYRLRLRGGCWGRQDFHRDFCFSRRDGLLIPAAARQKADGRKETGRRKRAGRREKRGIS